MLVASRTFQTTKAADVVVTFHEGGERHGFRASMLTDNVAIFTAESRHGRCAMENELAGLGIAYKHSRPYHPQDLRQGRAVPPDHQEAPGPPAQAGGPGHLQAQLDRLRTYYNTVRPHRAIGRRTPVQTFAARAKATPKKPPILAEGHHRVRQDRIDKAGCVTLRYRSKLLHIGVGRVHAGVRVLRWSTTSTSGHHRGRRATPASGSRPDQGLPSNRPAEGPVSALTLSSMSRDTYPGCLATQRERPRQDSNLRPAA